MGETEQKSALLLSNPGALAVDKGKFQEECSIPPVEVREGTSWTVRKEIAGGRGNDPRGCTFYQMRLLFYQMTDSPGICWGPSRKLMGPSNRVI